MSLRPVRLEAPKDLMSPGELWTPAAPTTIAFLRRGEGKEQRAILHQLWVNSAGEEEWRRVPFIHNTDGLRIAP